MIFRILIWKPYLIMHLEVAQEFLVKNVKGGGNWAKVCIQPQCCISPEDGVKETCCLVVAFYHLASLRCLLDKNDLCSMVQYALKLTTLCSLPINKTLGFMHVIYKKNR